MTIGTTTCPFCGDEVQVPQSEYPVTNVHCWCGAMFNNNNYDDEVELITHLPRTEYIVKVSTEVGIPFGEADSLDDAVDNLFATIAENPREVLDIDHKRNAVSVDTIHDVLEAGIHGDGVPISESGISPSQIELYGVEVPERYRQ